MEKPNGSGQSSANKSSDDGGVHPLAVATPCSTPTDAFRDAYDEWVASKEGCAGEKFDRMVQAREKLRAWRAGEQAFARAPLDLKALVPVQLSNMFLQRMGLMYPAHPISCYTLLAAVASCAAERNRLRGGIVCASEQTIAGVRYVCGLFACHQGAHVDAFGLASWPNWPNSACPEERTAPSAQDASAQTRQASSTAGEPVCVEPREQTAHRAADADDRLAEALTRLYVWARRWRQEPTGYNLESLAHAADNCIRTATEQRRQPAAVWTGYMNAQVANACAAGCAPEQEELRLTRTPVLADDLPVFVRWVTEVCASRVRVLSAFGRKFYSGQAPLST